MHFRVKDSNEELKLCVPEIVLTISSIVSYSLI